VLWPAVEPGLPAVGDAEAELGRNRHLVAPTLQRAAEQLLVDEGPIDLGRVEKGAAELDRPVQRRDRLRLIGRPVGLAHAHAAEADGRDFQPLAAELVSAEAHVSVSSDKSALAKL